MNHIELEAASRATDNPTFRGLDRRRRWQFLMACEDAVRAADARLEGEIDLDSRAVTRQVGRRLRAAGMPLCVWLLLAQVAYRVVKALIDLRR